ncbi:MAG: DUF4091 domain-containing protein [Clostridia bacterium]|nr:DUF4091 domain-containing protein [Clostridia bacterium]
MRIKTVSGLKKVFLDEDIVEKKQLLRGSCLKNECYHYEVLFDVEEVVEYRIPALLKVVSPISDCVKVRRLNHVPVQMAAFGTLKDEHYLRTKPGLYPDILQDIDFNAPLSLTNTLQTLYVEIDPEGKYEAGEYPIRIEFYDFNNKDNLLGASEFTLEIIDAFLPEQDIICDQWFYCDCLQDYYETEMFDEKHWKIIENFMKTAVKRGLNIILTPVFTPPLDTYVGGERPTTQLVDVTVENGKYTFGFDKLKRWVELCNKVGFKYFEISHLFTQWGVEFCPKVMATVDGEYKKIFGWETSATSKEYTEFLQSFMPEFIDFMKSMDNADKRCYFHISDEPRPWHIENYLAAKGIVKEYLKDYKIMDAMSSYELYTSGAVDMPVPGNDFIDPFLENKVEGLWTYYCCSECVDVSNRFISMPLSRTRILGTQMYKFGIVGFLHWGYNYYNNQNSYGSVNPFLCTDGDYFGQAGDAFSVYPGKFGQPIESVRLVTFHEAIQDNRALKLCESLIGREKTLELLGDGKDMTFKEYPREESYLLEMRERINKAIKQAVSKK